MLSEESYQEVKKDYLALAITIVDIIDGAAYLFDKEHPANGRNWKAELKLEQYRHVLQPNSRKEATIEKEGN